MHILAKALKKVNAEDTYQSIISQVGSIRFSKPQWTNFYNTLLSMTPESHPAVDGEFVIYRHTERDYHQPTDSINVSMRLENRFVSYADGEDIGLDFVPWRYWLNCPISERSVSNHGLLSCVSLILNDMSRFGILESDMEEAARHAAENPDEDNSEQEAEWAIDAKVSGGMSREDALSEAARNEELHEEDDETNHKMMLSMVTDRDKLPEE